MIPIDNSFSLYLSNYANDSANLSLFGLGQSGLSNAVIYDFFVGDILNMTANLAGDNVTASVNFTFVFRRLDGSETYIPILIGDNVREVIQSTFNSLVPLDVLQIISTANPKELGCNIYSNSNNSPWVKYGVLLPANINLFTQTTLTDYYFEGTLVTIRMSNDSINYNVLKNSQSSNPLICLALNIFSENAQQVESAMQVVRFNADGNGTTYQLDPVIDPYASLNEVMGKKLPQFILDGNTLVNYTLLAESSVRLDFIFVKASSAMLFNHAFKLRALEQYKMVKNWIGQHQGQRRSLYVSN